MNRIKIISIVILLIGVMLICSGIFFKLRHWPDSFYGTYSGSILILFSILLLIITNNKTKK